MGDFTVKPDEIRRELDTLGSLGGQIGALADELGSIHLDMHGDYTAELQVKIDDQTDALRGYGKKIFLLKDTLTDSLSEYVSAEDRIIGNLTGDAEINDKDGSGSKPGADEQAKDSAEEAIKKLLQQLAEMFSGLGSLVDIVTLLLGVLEKTGAADVLGKISTALTLVVDTITLVTTIGDDIKSAEDSYEAAGDACADIIIELGEVGIQVAAPAVGEAIGGAVGAMAGGVGAVPGAAIGSFIGSLGGGILSGLYKKAMTEVPFGGKTVKEWISNAVADNLRKTVNNMKNTAAVYSAGGGGGGGQAGGR